MSEHGQFSFTFVRSQFRHRRRVAKLVRQRLYSHGHTDHGSDLRSPYSGAGNNDIRGEYSVGRLNTSDATLALIDGKDLAIFNELRAAADRPLTHHFVSQ